MNTASWANGSGADITPFWSRVPSFFLFPIHIASLLRIFAFSVVAAIGAYASSPVAIVVATGGLSLIAWIGFLRYGGLVLSETSLGHLSPHQYPQTPDESLAYIPFKIFAFYLIAGAAIGFAAGLFGDGAAHIANFVVTVLSPAALIVLIISRSLFTGLNPGASFGVIRAIGKPYFLLCLFIYCLSASQVFLSTELIENAVQPLMAQWAEIQSAAQEVDSHVEAERIEGMMAEFDTMLASMRPRFAISLFLINAVAMYFSLIAFNMMGYVAYQFHKQLGLEVDDQPRGRASASAAAQADPEAAQIAKLVAEGNVEQALEIAYERQRVDWEDAAALERYNKLLHLAGKDDRLAGHTQKLIPLLLRKGQARNALAAYQRSRERKPDFRLDDAALGLQLAEAARSSRETKTAAELLESMIQQAPRNGLIPDALFLLGRIYCEDLRQDERAEQLFRDLSSKYPNHPLSVEADRFLQVLARLRAPAPARPA